MKTVNIDVVSLDIKDHKFFLKSSMGCPDMLIYKTPYNWETVELMILYNDFYYLLNNWLMCMYNQIEL